MRGLVICSLLAAIAGVGGVGGVGGVAWADSDGEITIAVAACEHGAAEQCLAAAAQMEQRHTTARLGHSASELRARAEKLFEDHCTAGDGDACFERGRLLERKGGDGAARGQALVERGCDLHSGRACLELAIAAKTRAIATKRFEQACAAGNGDGCEQLAERVPARAAELHEKACDNHNRTGCEKAGALALAAGDRATAAARFAQACEFDDMARCDRAGTLLEDAAHARELLQKACDGDFAAACAHLAPFVATGKGGARDWGHGLELAQKSCDLAHARGQPKTCPLVAELRKHPPDPSCSGADECKRFCDEQIGGSCRLLAELSPPRERESLYGQACQLGDSASCAIAGDAADAPETAAGWYADACKLGDARSCTLARFRDAVKGTGGAREALAKACKTDIDACIMLGLAHESAHDTQGAVEIWKDACARKPGAACRLVAYGTPQAFVGFGPLCAETHNDDACFAEAIRLAQQACDAHDAIGCEDVAHEQCVMGDHAACSRYNEHDDDPRVRPTWPAPAPRWE